MVKKFQMLISTISFKRVCALFIAVFVICLTIIPLFSLSTSAYANNNDVFYVYVLDDGGNPFVNPDCLYYFNSYDTIEIAASTNDLLFGSSIPLQYHTGYDYYYGLPITVDLTKSYINTSTYEYYNRLVITGIDDLVAYRVFDQNGNQISFQEIMPSTVPSFTVYAGYSYLFYTKSGDSSIDNITVDARFNLAIDSTGGGGSDESYQDGYNDGYNAGYNDGYDIGSNDGYSNGLEFSLYNTIMQPIDALFTLRIGLLPLGDILLVIVGISLVVIFLKYFAGG